MRFLQDGALEMTNNRSERELRRVAVGRNAWLFVGSDAHGQAAGNLLTLIASARLHELDRDVGWLTIPEPPLPTMLSTDDVVSPPSAAP